MVWPYSTDGQRNPFPSYRIAAWDSVIAALLDRFKLLFVSLTRG